MVLAVITVYVICWLPYWTFQLALLSVERSTDILVQLFQLITFLSYANSAVNPILYAFLSENFRKTFARAFGCTTAADVNRALLANERHSGACTQMHAKAGEEVPITHQLPSPPAAETATTTGASDETVPHCAALVAVDAVDAEMEVLLDNSSREQIQQEQML
jgi:7 transmembrane receptor (rhodopsin family)